MTTPLLPLLFALALATGATRAQPAPGTPPADGVVEVEFDRGTDFGRFRTFAWSPDLQPAKNETFHRLIVGAVERELVKRGLAKADRPVQSPTQLLVTYWTQADVRIKGSTSEKASPMGPDQRSIVTTFERERIGRLGIELLDGISRATLWRARGSGLVESTAETGARIEASVGRLLADFPPKTTAR
jgi:hypothetical protein